MAYNFKRADRETPYLMPPSLSEWLPENHLAKFRRRYRADGLGASAYDPELMVGLMLYAYCVGERSSRKIEEACTVDVAYRVVAGNLLPDYSTICRFRAEHEDELKGLFRQVLRMCGKAGLVKAGTVALDGTKMKASAAKSANRSYDHLQEEIDRMFEEAKRKDAEEDKLYGKGRRGNELPEHLNTREKQAKWIAAEMERIKREAAAEAATGERKRGRKPAPPDPEPAADEKADPAGPELFIATNKDWKQRKLLRRVWARLAADPPALAPAYA